MPVRRKIPYNNGLYFITFTCYKWLRLLEYTNGYDLVYKWFDYLKTQNHRVVGYVIMPNHLHVMIWFSQTEKSINKIVEDGKRFIAYEIIKRLKEKSYSGYWINFKKQYPYREINVVSNMRYGKNHLIGNFAKQ